MSKIQNEDIKSSAQLIAAGGSASQLPNDTKIYVTANSINKTLNQAIIDQDIGGAAGGPVNLITNPSADVNGNGAAAYADAAGTSPVDGTGGSPTVTIARTTTTPLRGAGSFLFTKPASNVQGQGFSILFDCPLAFRAKVLQIQFSYIVASGTFAAGSQSTDSDITVWVVGVTSGRVSQPTTFKLFSNSTTIADTFISNFQSSAEDTQYRLCFHVGSTSASAFSLEFDDIIVSPTTLSYGTPITDWQAYIPSNTQGFGTFTGAAFAWRRIGDSLQVRGYGTTGTVTGVQARISFPDGIPSAASNLAALQLVGDAIKNQQTGSQFRLFTFAQPNTNYFVFGTGTSGSAGFVGDLASNIIPSSTLFSFHATVPIQGWSAQVQSSDVNDQRIVAAKYGITSNLGVTADTTIIFPQAGVSYDSHGAYNSTTGEYRIPISGNYVFTIDGAYLVGGAVSQIRLWKNGVAQGSMTMTMFGIVQWGSFSDRFVAGDIVTIRSDTSGTLEFSANRYNASITVQRVANPASITSTETVAVIADTFTTTSYGAGGTILFTNKTTDTHNAFVASTGIFTAPVRGFYCVNFVSPTTSSGGTTVFVSKNNNAFTNTGRIGDAQTGIGVSGSNLVQLNAGENIRIKDNVGITWNGTGGNLSIYKIGI